MTSSFRTGTLAMAGTLLAAGLALPAGSHAQPSAASYPDKPVRLLVPYPAGGAMDMVGRLFGKTFSDLSGQPVIVENRPGAGTAIAANVLAAAPADGYTLLLAPNATMSITPQLYAKPPFDASRLEPLAQVGTNQMVLSASQQSGIATLDALLAQARSQPDSVSYGSFGNGTITHLLGELLSQSANAPMLHVAYQGAAPAMNSLLGGNITTTFDTITNAQPQIQGGKLRGLAVTGQQRSALLPDTPTFVELGYPQLALDSWVGVVAPVGLDPALKARLQDLIGRSLQDEAFRQQMQARGFDVPDADPAALPELIENERQLYRQVIDQAGIRLD